MSSALIVGPRIKSGRLLWRELQIVGPATEKARRPLVLSYTEFVMTIMTTFVIIIDLQDDLVVMGTLTVRENLMFSANLRLPGSFLRNDKRHRVEEILEELGLMTCADTKVSRVLQLPTSLGPYEISTYSNLCQRVPWICHLRRRSVIIKFITHLLVQVEQSVSLCVCLCVFMCVDNNFGTKWPSTQIFDVLVHSFFIILEGHGSKFSVTGWKSVRFSYIDVCYRATLADRGWKADVILNYKLNPASKPNCQYTNTK